MGKNKTAIGFLVFISIFILGFSAMAQQASTKAVKINFKELPGKWTYQGTTPRLIIPESAIRPAPKTADTGKSASAHPQSETMKLDKSKFVPMHKATLIFNNSNLEFLADKTCVKTKGENKVTYTWKKSGKNLLYLKSAQSKDKIKLVVSNLNSDTLLLSQSFETGSLYFFYLREK
jgi:hypothetical protein